MYAAKFTRIWNMIAARIIEKSSENRWRRRLRGEGYKRKEGKMMMGTGIGEVVYG